MDWGQPKVNRTLLPRVCCSKFLYCQNFPLPTWWNLNHTGPQEMLLLWSRSPRFPRGNELHVPLHWSDSLHLHTGCFFQPSYFLAEISIPPFLNKSTSCFETQFLWEAFFHKCLWYSVSCSQCLLVCLLQPRAWQRVCVMSLWLSMYTAAIKCYTHSFLLINQIQITETFLNWKTLEREDSFTL